MEMTKKIQETGNLNEPVSEEDVRKLPDSQEKKAIEEEWNQQLN